ncbi:hypothetical protein NIES4072_51870 [Nostoc commune NIES-4072]|uniref:Uncharacterized protein n=1 Tax=Nostoc commune NIES-4072 TaxID=2005467 RepID=A0A2R5G093_NOSCO|nr:hypothetical protein NIES4070_39080 [Nostoc commune HK-02]GBG21501.1 hypothetical protein NIES4072_51870 [Nostoc commune NIES-4072]
MKTNFRIKKFIILCIGVYILIPKIATYTGMFNTASATSGDTLIARKVNSQNLRDVYIPPNYGGPDSQHGSGTR